MNVFEKLVRIIAPHECLVCNKEGELVCVWCVQDCFPMLPSRCFRCKSFSSDNSTCDVCRRHTKIKHCWVATDYDAVAKKLLTKYKFARAKGAHSIISGAMIGLLPDLPRNTKVVPVPTATVRVRMRGYDHAGLIAKDISRHTGLPYAPIVSRLTQTRQVGSDKAHRLTQLKDAFFVRDVTKIKGKDVLIVDDITTTGATINCLAETLYRAGAKQINAVVFTQKL